MYIIYGIFTATRTNSFYRDFVSLFRKFCQIPPTFCFISVVSRLSRRFCHDAQHNPTLYCPIVLRSPETPTFSLGLTPPQVCSTSLAHGIVVLFRATQPTWLFCYQPPTPIMSHGFRPPNNLISSYRFFDRLNFLHAAIMYSVTPNIHRVL